MKKLLVTMIGAATAIGAFADPYINAERFDGFQIGDKPSVADLGAALWSEAQDATNTYEVVAAGTVSAPASQPDYYTGGPDKALHIQTTFGKPLNFNVASNAAPKAIGDGLYFDSLVKFTVCDSEPKTDYENYDGAKIILWLQTTDDESVTNLMVKAGYLTYNLGVSCSTNPIYTCASVGSTFADNWHRVTIKAIADITPANDGATVPGFVVFIDGEALNVADNYAVWDSEFETQFANLTGEAEKWYGEDALFPSMDQSNNYNTLVSASFDGTGDITDLVFTDAGPSFAIYADPEAAVIIDGEPVANIDTFAKAVTAVNGASAGSVVKLTLSQNLSIAEGFEISSPATVTIDFAGNTITSSIDDDMAAAIVNNGATLIFTNSTSDVGGIICTDAGLAFRNDAGAVEIAAGIFDGIVSNGGVEETDIVLISGGSFRQNATALSSESVSLDDGKTLSLNGNTGLYDVVVDDEPAPTVITIAENPWYENPKAVVLAENLPGQTGNIVSAFHGQGEGEYLGLTYSTNPQQFDLFTVDGTNTPTTVISLASGDASLNMPGFRGVAISKTLGIAMTLAYYAASNMYVFPLTGGAATVVSKPSTYSFDAAAFSPDGKYLFSNALNGESSNQFYVKWEVSDGGATLTKVGSISAGGRGRNLAYARINGRDLVFALIDTGKVAVLDMTGDDSSAWTATDLITNLPAHSYGTLCVSGVTAVDAQGDPATPHLTVATSTNNGATKIDVLNVYALTVPASDAVSAELTKSFDEDALTAFGFGDISDANRYGNTVYVTEDEATIYFARPDNKLYAAQWAPSWKTYLGEAVDGAYEIDNLAELKAFQANVGTLPTVGLTFKLTSNIALDAAWPGIGIQNGKDIYTTAEFDEGAFCGTFDGQNYTISGFQMVGGGLDYCGFFNSTYGATIQNLKIQYDGALFATDTSANSSLESGATFVGVAKNSTLRNLTTLAGTVSCDKGFGGIVGYLTSGTLVDSCTNNVNMTSLKPNKCGGIAMITQGGSAVTIQNCQNNGTIAGSNETGGLVGFIGLDTTITDCESTVAYKLFHHNNGTVTLSGVKGNATVVSYTGAATPGLNFATVDGNVATFVADDALEAGKTYKVMAAGATATFEFAEASTIAFDTSLASPTYAITENGSYAITANTDGTTTTYTAVVAVAKIAGGANYATLKDAVDAADTGDTVTTLTDCVVDNGNTGITFTKGINLVNNYTITINGANYALRIANGTTTPVTMSGTGSLVWANGSGSPILVGCNEIKSSYGINAFCEGSFVLNGGTLTSTDKTAKGGNLVKLEAGTFVLNDGTINGGTRGVKADSEGNNATCVLTINGGTIVNTNSAAIAASTAGSGSSTVVVNGGTFTGAIVGANMVTIPGTSTAKFDRDQSSFCESGYETTLSDGWYVVTAIPPAGIDPEVNTPVEVAATSAVDATNNVVVVAPTGVDAAAYKDLFDFTVTEVTAGEKYSVSIAGIKEAVEEAVEASAIAVIAEEANAVTVPAGLNYKITTYETLGGTAVQTKTGTSNGAGVEVSKPGTTQGFIKVEMGTTPYSAE